MKYLPFVYLAGGLLLLYILNRSLQKFGLGFTKSENEEKADALTDLEPFDSNFVSDLIKEADKRNLEAKKRIYAVGLSVPKTVAEMAKKIYDSKGYFKDNESGTIAVIRSIKYQTQISQISAQMLKSYERDLLTYLRSFMNDGELAVIYDIIKKKPVGWFKNGKIEK